MGYAIVFLGPPGSGKGTQSKLLSKKIGINHYSTGDLLRDAVKNATKIGIEAKGFMDRGELVPDTIILALIGEIFECDKPHGITTTKGFILDGFPRNEAQADELDVLLKRMKRDLSHVFYFKLSDKEVVKRLSGRRVCKGCNRNYHIVFDKPKKDGVCDDCGGSLYQRADDNENTVMNRLEVYRKSTESLLNYYKKKGLLIEIDASFNVDAVMKQLIEALNHGN